MTSWKEEAMAMEQEESWERERERKTLLLWEICAEQLVWRRFGVWGGG
jgi:hypothetical protein